MEDSPEKNPDCSTSATARRLSSKRRKIAFALLLLLGLAVRLAYITSESVWWDEFATVAFLNPPPAYEASPHFERWNQQVIRQPSPTLGAFLRQNRRLDPAAMPMYLVVEYYWNRYIHASPVALRLLSVLLGLAVLPVLYLLGKFLFGPGAGLIALFCAALSPIHIQFSKEIRMYGLMTLLAVVVVYAFCRLLENRRRRWWLLYAVSALFLSWTHPFALLLPFTLGFYWLLAYPKDIMRLFKWGVLTAMVTVPAALWVLTIQFWGQDSTEGWMRAPTLVELLNDIFADDAIGATYQVNATPWAWAWLTGEVLARRIISWRWAVGRAAVVGALAAFVWLFTASTLLRGGIPGESGRSRKTVVRFSQFLLLALWTTVPSLVLYTLSLVWRPCHQPRYTVHASLALYLAVGAAVMTLPKRVFRVAAMVCLVLFYGYQQMLMLGEPQHPDFLSASRVIHEKAQPTDLVLAHNWLWKRVFAYNLGPVPNVVCYGSTYEILAEKSAFFLDPATPAASDSRSVWVVVQTDYFTVGTIVPLEQAFDAHGLDWTAHEFGGIQRVILYHVRRREDTPPYQPTAAPDSTAPKEFSDLAMEYWRAGTFDMAVAASKAALCIQPDHARAWSYLGMSYKELERSAEALDAFQRALEIDPEDYPWTLNNHAELLIHAGQYAEAVAITQKALEALPGDPWCLALLGRAYHELGDYEQAHKVLTEAVTKDAQDMRIRQWLAETEAARTEAEP